MNEIVSEKKIITVQEKKTHTTKFHSLMKNFINKLFNHFKLNKITNLLHIDCKHNQSLADAS